MKRCFLFFENDSFSFHLGKYVWYYWLKCVHRFSRLWSVTGYLVVSLSVYSIIVFFLKWISFYSNRISLISKPSAKDEGLITVCLEVKPAYLCLNHCTRTCMFSFHSLVFRTPMGDDKAVVPQCCRIIGLHLSRSSTAEEGLCHILSYMSGRVSPQFKMHAFPFTCTKIEYCFIYFNAVTALN